MNYKDSKIIKMDAQLDKALLHAKNKQFNVAISDLSKLSKEGYSKATQQLELIKEEAYEYTVEQYRNSKTESLIFEQFDGYKDAEKYLILINSNPIYQYFLSDVYRDSVLTNEQSKK